MVFRLVHLTWERYIPHCERLMFRLHSILVLLLQMQRVEKKEAEYFLPWLALRYNCPKLNHGARFRTFLPIPNVNTSRKYKPQVRMGLSFWLTASDGFPFDSYLYGFIPFFRIWKKLFTRLCLHGDSEVQGRISSFPAWTVFHCATASQRSMERAGYSQRHISRYFV